MGGDIRDSGGCLGILAGSGSLPWLVIEYCRDVGRDFVVVSFKGQSYEREFTGILHKSFSLGSVGGYVKFLRAHNVSELILCGSLERPDLLSLRPDMVGVRVLGGLLGRSLGDDGLLRRVMDELESLTGACVIGYEDIFGDIEWDLGSHGRYEPGEVDFLNISRGDEVFGALSSCDIGQSLVIQGGLVIGVEAIEGTDRLLERCGLLLREGSRGLLFKKMKVGQSRRADLPVIGVRTVEGVGSAGLHGLVIGRNGVIILDYDEVIRVADSLGLFFHVIV